jgi:hypothetical protein
MTRPDLAWSYSELSKYDQNPGKAHMDAAHHVLRYLRATYDQAIVYERTNEMANTIWGWVDSDWAVTLRDAKTGIKDRYVKTGRIRYMPGYAGACAK